MPAYRSKRRFHIWRPRGFWGWVGFLVLTPIAVFTVLWTLDAQRVNMPDTIGSARRVRVEDPLLREAAEVFESTFGAPADGAGYRDLDGTRFQVFAGALDSTDAAGELETFVTNLRSRGLRTASSIRSFQRGDVDYACLAVSAPEVGTLCAWADGETLGYVSVDNVQMGRARGILVDVHEAVRS
jgi:hypothetical protein